MPWVSPSTSETQTVTNFFLIVTPPTAKVPNPEYEDLNDLMNTVFSPNPSVGITSYGPQFQGASAVRALFRQIFITFNNLVFTEVPPRYFYRPPNQPEGIAVQTQLFGLQYTSWFPRGSPYYSPPISNITPDGNHSMTVDAAAFFSFDNNFKVTQLALYFDRYSMSQQLALAAQSSSS
jgi:hypothetical protein